MQFQVGDLVVFTGREKEMGKYHPDYAQLIGHLGTVVEADDVAPFEYVVIFSEFPDSDGFCDYPCRADELSPLVDIIS